MPRIPTFILCKRISPNAGCSKGEAFMYLSLQIPVCRHCRDLKSASTHWARVCCCHLGIKCLLRLVSSESLLGFRWTSLGNSWGLPGAYWMQVVTNVSFLGSLTCGTFGGKRHATFLGPMGGPSGLRWGPRRASWARSWGPCSAFWSLV